MQNKKIVYPDYNHSLVNLMASIRKFFNCPSKHSSLKNVDELLESGKYRSVILFLLDGMGTKIMEQCADETKFMREHMIDEITAVFPSTTSASTTTVRTGETPIDNGWLGWHQYLEEVNDDVVMFNGNGYYSSNKYDKTIAYKIEAYETIFEKIQKAGYKADEYFPGWHSYNPVDKFSDMIKKAKKFANSGIDKQYLYCYWDNPDHDLHDSGVDSKVVHKGLKKIDSLFKNFIKSLPEDAICFVVADHGHIKTDFVNLANYPDLLDTLYRLPSIEPRNSSFFVYKEKEDEFKTLFKKYFGDSFLLLTKEEVIDKELFGVKCEHPEHYKYLGEYQAVAIADKAFDYSPTNEPNFMVSTHAGLTEDEMLVPLIKLVKK